MINAKIFPFKSYFWSIHQGSTLVFEVTLENLSRSQDWHGSGRVEAEFVFWCQGLICHGSFSQSCCRAKINIKDFSLLSSSQSALSQFYQRRMRSLTVAVLSWTCLCYTRAAPQAYTDQHRGIMDEALKK